MKKLAVIILNWNGIALLKRFLPDAVKYSISADSDLIVADNGSTDDSVAWIKEKFPEVKLLEFDENYGFAKGYNMALRQTGYPYTVLLNSDVKVSEGWWQPLLDFMESHPQAGACQPKIMACNNPEMFEYAGAAGGLIDALGYPYCRGRLFDICLKDEGQYDGNPCQVAWASGAALMVRTDIYERLGGLDENFYAHMEEIDLCFRMRNAGYKCYAISDSKVYHVGGASLSKENPKKTYLNFRNNLLLLHKNLPGKKGKKILLLRRLADTLAFFKFLVSGEWSHARAVLKAHGDFKKMRGKYTCLPQKDIFKELPGTERWIVIDRYLKGKKS